MSAGQPRLAWPLLSRLLEPFLCSPYSGIDRFSFVSFNFSSANPGRAEVFDAEDMYAENVKSGFGTGKFSSAVNDSTSRPQSEDPFGMRAPSK